MKGGVFMAYISENGSGINIVGTPENDQIYSTSNSNEEIL